MVESTDGWLVWASDWWPTDKALALVGENLCGCNSFGRVLAFQARSSRFETCHPHQRIKAPLRRGFLVPENP